MSLNRPARHALSLLSCFVLLVDAMPLGMTAWHLKNEMGGFMESEKMREEFEAWVIGHHIGAGLNGEVWTDESCEALFGKFVYDDWDVQNSWASWQASRESLAIELPMTKDLGFGEAGKASADTWNGAMTAVSTQLKSLGLKVKP